MKNEVKLVIDTGTAQNIIVGWKQLSITRGIEQIPNTFNLQMSEKVPDLNYVEVRKGDKCKVYIDDDLVITGYVDRVIPIINGNQHIIQVIGRGKCSDLVDCSAVWKGMQFQNMTALNIAQSLCEDYEIEVTSEVETKVISVQNINLGETPAAVLDRVCRVAQVLYYEDENGNLILSRERNDEVTGSLVQGVNIESAVYNNGMDQLYSDYIVVIPSAPLTMDQTSSQETGYYIVKDRAINRYRPLYIIPEDGDAGFEVAEKRAMWEQNRRYARSNMLNITVSSWRNIEEKLYKPNTQVQINLPSLKVIMQTWLIGEVTYRKDEMGTRCDLTIMPLGAFTPEPILPFKGLPTDVLNANSGVTQ
jgi:prophage tail gpP-like protein